MSLSDIAEGVAITRSQEDRGVAVVDRTGEDRATALATFASDLPCEAAEAAAMVEAYEAGASVGEAATAAGRTPTTAAKTLHLLGFEGLSPLSPIGRELCRDWLAGELTRTEAQELADASDREFALGAYVETHDPLAGVQEVIEDVSFTERDAMVEKRDALADTMTEATEFF